MSGQDSRSSLVVYTCDVSTAFLQAAQIEADSIRQTFSAATDHSTYRGELLSILSFADDLIFVYRVVESIGIYSDSHRVLCFRVPYHWHIKKNARAFVSDRKL